MGVRWGYNPLFFRSHVESKGDKRISETIVILEPKTNKITKQIKKQNNDHVYHYIQSKLLLQNVIHNYNTTPIQFYIYTILQYYNTTINIIILLLLLSIVRKERKVFLSMYLGKDSKEKENINSAEKAPDLPRSSMFG